ncbi:protein FAM107B-like [Acipenser ruthenus]|uniref:protein FAM107B-like n=1 Tax=Acipenser ruthenus TaxID=7906 RepID=UPI0015600375|nr:protein FAM107B-like [Acipenser ruthenus]XP_058860082.1 protein FAM107B-like [Acipenser ruthenus]
MLKPCVNSAVGFISLAHQWLSLDVRFLQKNGSFETARKSSVRKPSPLTTMGGSHAKRTGFRKQRKEDYSIRTPPSYLDTDSPQDLIQPRKVTHPVLDSQRHQDLHRELVLSCKRGLLPENKPELQRVLEQRKLEQLREQEEAQRPKSDLEQELKKRQQKLELYEQEQMKPKADEEDVPEFVKVKENLRRLKLNGE